MTREEIAALIEVAAATRPPLVEYRRGQASLRIRFDAAGAPLAATFSDTPEPLPQTAVERSVTSPGMGFFSARHPASSRSDDGPEKDVEADQIVGFLRTGDILTPVVAAHAGKLRQIKADGSLVGYGDILYTYLS